MKKQGKLRILSLVMVFTLILNLISPTMMVFADNENVKLTLTTNKTKVESKEQVEFSLNYEALNGPGSIKDGDVITFKLPDIFKDITPKYPTEHFKSVTVDGTTVTATFSEGANDAIDGYINVKATAKDVNENTTQRVEANLNGNIQYINVEVVPPEDNSSGGKKTGMVALADSKNVKLTLTTNKTKVESGEQVEFSLKYEALNGPGSIKDGDVLTFELPDIFKGINPIYPPEHFKSVTVDGTTVTAVFSEGANDAIGGYINIKATAKDVDKNTTQRVEVNLNGNIQYIDVEVVPPEDNSSGGGEQPGVVDREIYKVVENPDGYEGYEDGTLINNINNPVVGKKVKYSIYVNEKYALQYGLHLTDNMPEGMTLVEDSVKVYETQYGQAEKDVTDAFNKGKMDLQDNSLHVYFGDTYFKYRVSYDVIINQAMPRYDNVANLIDYKGTKTSTAIVKPKDDGRMLLKYSSTNERGKDENGNPVNIVNMVGDKVKYTLDVNPNNQKVENAVVEDVIPDGMKLVDGSIMIGAYDITHDFEWVTDQMKDKIKFEDNKLTVDIGDTNKHYLIYYDLEVTKREKSYENKAKLSYDNTSKEVNNVVRYEMNAGAINARKAVDKATLKEGDSQIINYTINFDCYGYFNKGYLNLTDKLDPRVQILEVDAPEHFTVNIDKDTNTINVTNDKKEIDYGEKLQVKIKTDFTNVDDGSTISNIAKINSSTTNTVETKKGYKFSAKKVDSDTKSPLEGATFELMDNNKQVIAKLNSDSQGVISYSIDKPGDYYLKEVKAPTGYTLDSKEIKFTVNDSDIGTTVNIGNIANSKSNHNVTIKKVDASDEKKVLLGAEFEIQDLKGNKVTTVTTDSNGLANLNLLPGKYQAIEKKAPVGYILNSKPVEFEVKLGDSSDVNLVIKNDKIVGSLEITKVDSKDNKKVLEGTEFTIFDSNKKEVAKAVTDKDGKVVFDNLGYGNYYYQETKAPEGYVIDSKMYPFEIKEKGQVISKTVTNDKIVVDDKIVGKIEITKTDSKDSKKVLSNTEFTIFDSNKKEVAKGVTDKEGKVVFDNLEYGNYYYQEIKAPEGYTIDNKMYPFEIATKDQVIKKTVTNEKIVGSLEITKVDSKDNKKVLEGTEFTIFDSNKKEVSKAVTGKDGKVVFDNLGYGNYYYQETKAPKGYKIDNKMYPFEMATKDQVVKKTVTNEKIHEPENPSTGEPSNPGESDKLGSIEITKVDSKDNKKILEGTEFTIFDSNKKEVAKAVTGKDGKVVFGNLGYGNYYYQEAKAPKGYKIDNNMYPFEINTDKEVLRVSVTNEKISEPEKPEKPNTGDPNNSGNLDKPEKPNIGDQNNSGESEKPNTGNTGSQGESDKSENSSTEKSSNTGKSDNPKTSDSGILPYIGLFVASTVGLAVNNRRRK